MLQYMISSMYQIYIQLMVNYHYVNPTKCVGLIYKADLILISLTINLFSPWYSWNIADLVLNNNPSLIPTTNVNIHSLLWISMDSKRDSWSAYFSFISITWGSKKIMYMKIGKILAPDQWNNKQKWDRKPLKIVI